MQKQNGQSLKRFTGERVLSQRESRSKIEKTNGTNGRSLKVFTGDMCCLSMNHKHHEKTKN
jgi:hypothetical protein